MRPELHFLPALETRWRSQLRRGGVPLTPPLHAVPVSDSPGADGYFVYSHGSRRPSLVLKVHTDPRGKRYLAQEASALATLAKVPALNGLVPRGLGLFEEDGQTLLAQTYVGGVPLETRVQRQRRTQRAPLEYDLFRAQVWLQLFQEATAAGVSPFPGASAVWDSMALIERAGGLDDGLRHLADNLALDAEACRGMVMMRAGQHGRFGPRYVLTDGGQLNVIHWRHFSTDATVWDDLFWFVISLAECIGACSRPARDRLGAFSHTFLGSGLTAQCAREFVARYLRAMHLPEEQAHLFFGLFLMQRAAKEAAGISPVSGGWLDRLRLYAAGAEQSVLRPVATFGQPGPAELVPIR